MRSFLLIVFLIFSTAISSFSQVSVVKTAAGWELANGHIRLELARSAGTVKVVSLRREGGAEWAVANTPIVASPDNGGAPYIFANDLIAGLDKGGKQLIL